MSFISFHGFFSEQATLADMMALGGFDALETELPGVLAKYPVLKAFHERIRKDPKLTSYLASRPDSNM